MLRSILTVFMLPVLLLLGSSSDNSAARVKQRDNEIQIETVEKLTVASGNTTIDLDLNRLNDAVLATENAKPLGPELVAEGPETLHFALASDSFFTIIVTNGVFRALNPGSIGLTPQNAANLPALLNASFQQLVLEQKQSGDAYDLVVRDSKSGFVFFNVEGQSHDYDANNHSFSVQGGRLLVSEE